MCWMFLEPGELRKAASAAGLLHARGYGVVVVYPGNGGGGHGADQWGTPVATLRVVYSGSYSGVTVGLQWADSGVTVELQWADSGNPLKTRKIMKIMKFHEKFIKIHENS